MKRILLGQLGANGDCLYATIIARQLRHDHPDAEITWAISSQCSRLIANNPHVDAVWEIEIPSWDLHESMWRLFEREALRRYGRREFDDIYLTQIWPNNFHNYDGTVRSSLLRNLGRPITVPIENVIVLDDVELERVSTFARQAGLADREHRILFECSSKSGQSFVTPEVAQDVADELYDILPNSMVIFSTHLPMVLRDTRSRYAGGISLREIAELTQHCSLFVGCGSGGTVSATSTASKPLPNVQILSRATSVYASFAHDFEYFGLTGRPIIEITEEDPRTIARCIASVCTRGIGAARAEFDEHRPVTFDHYLGLITETLVRRDRYLDVARALSITAERYGWAPELVDFGRRKVEPKLACDPSWLFPDNRRVADRFRHDLDAAGEGALLRRQRLWSEGSSYVWRDDSA
ncbi:hypothetical protein N7I30_19905 [Aurantimonas litoralis]|nr:hypothetical protein [Aurantimonas litoralis]